MAKIILSILLLCIANITKSQNSTVSIFFGPKVQQKLRINKPKIIEKYLTPKNAASFEVGASFSKLFAKKTYAFTSVSIGLLTNSLQSTNILSDSISIRKGSSIDEISTCVNFMIGMSYILIDNKNKLSTSFGFGVRKIFETTAGGFTRLQFVPNRNEIIEYKELPYYQGNYNSSNIYNPKLIPLIDLGISYSVFISKRTDLLFNSVYNFSLKDNYKAVYQLKSNNNIIDNGEIANKNGGFMFQIGCKYKIK